MVYFFYISMQNVGQKLSPKLLAHLEVEDPWNKNEESGVCIQIGLCHFPLREAPEPIHPSVSVFEVVMINPCSASRS